MLLGIDVGGTHTDAVLVDSSGIVSSFKTKTEHDNLLRSITTALEKVSAGIDRKKITNINLSTTLSTNAIVEQKLEKTGVFISSGPGLNPENIIMGDFTFIIPGSIDHRGRVVQELDNEKLQKGYEACRKQDVKVFASVTKFSTRNDSQEKEISGMIKPVSDFTTEGHSLSSQLSFPRRVATAYYNSAVWRIYNNFADAILKSVKNLGIDAPVNILKADGGTLPVSMSREFPVESILSGPAASIMGIIALCNITEDSVILDIGGTTTDIAVFVFGAPLIERDGISLGGYPTLIRSLKNRSIGIGGDSAITVKDGKVCVGPHRYGPCMADGGKRPSLIDAMNVRGITEYGDSKKSSEGINKLSETAGLPVKKLAEEAVNYAVQRIKDEIRSMLDEINQKPVYTIHEMIEGITVKPSRTYIIGGPAMALAKLLNHGTEVTVPENYEVANAVGAALARPTFEAELFADTGSGKMIIPNIGIEKNVDIKYSTKDAKEDAIRYLIEYLKKKGLRTESKDIDIIESSCFRMISDFHSSGNDIRIKCQIKPEVAMKLHA
ncbi:MAG: hydantoinase/oxoprolinase family protein [Spirochaetota bacterium]